MRLVKTINTLLFIILLSSLFSTSAYAAIYKCTLANGDIVYSSKKCSANSQTFNLKNEPVSTYPTSIEPKNSVDIYITSWCHYCKKAMAYLKSKNIPFNSYDIEKNARAKSKKMEIAPRYSGVPLTVINGTVLKGFSASRFDQALNL